MRKICGIFLAVVCLLLCISCAKKMAGIAETTEGVAGLAGRSELTTFLMAPPPPPPPGTVGRFIAVTHRFVVETSESELSKDWESVLKLCGRLDCEVLSSSITSKTASAPPKGEISLRIAPGNLDKLFNALNQLATIMEHTTESADKTAEVVDTDAKLKNKTEFRDRLRGMLAKSPGGVKEAIEVERELANVQAEIDSLATTQKSLQNQTRTGALAPIANAWEESGYVVAQSLGSLITFVMAVIPWLVLIIPAIWIILKLLSRRSRRKALPKKDSETAP
jgi:hypothetical protein